MTTFLKTHHIIKLLNAIDQNGRQVVTVSLASGNLTLYYLPKALLSSTISSKLTTLHKAAGHPSLDYLRKMFPKLNIPQFSCNTCSTCKMTKTPFSGNFPKATRRLEFLHINWCGPISPPSASGAQYIFRIIDGFSHFSWIFFLTSKAKIKEVLKKYIIKIKFQTTLEVEITISDNGKEFVNTDLQYFFERRGISHLTTAPYTPEQNPFARRGNQTTITKTRCLLKDSGLDLSLWA
ncbi:hypothetical protein O181_059674 [Austropuccinia psidii MF-1]|uniref:Integrase catalytic domain-containing protein n=1 Tax=Austropuccinia psidii MF-1 TaxID=1389203 RepID=A0A9Q3EEQ9_9BASI|nr:hypothetical protein [Austropuccinia psidii MF-1]